MNLLKANQFLTNQNIRSETSIRKADNPLLQKKRNEITTIITLPASVINHRPSLSKVDQRPKNFIDTRCVMVERSGEKHLPRISLDLIPLIRAGHLLPRRRTGV